MHEPNSSPRSEHTGGSRSPVRKPDFTRRVAVTGLCIVSPIGSDVDTVWQHLVDGVSVSANHLLGSDAVRLPGLRRGPRFRPGHLDELQGGPADRQERGLGVAAAKKALAHSGLHIDNANRDEIGSTSAREAVARGSSWKPGTPGDQGSPRGQPFYIANMLPDTASGQIAIETGIRGPNMCIVTACSTGTHNIGGGRRADPARRRHRGRGRFHESPLHELIHIGFSTCAAWGRRGPASRSRRSRGRSISPVTASSSARARAPWSSRTSSSRRRAGATIYAEVVGFGSAADAWDLIQPVEKGDGSGRAAAPGAGALRRAARVDRHDQSARDLHAPW